mmetsp:Transcript_66780/g.132370  ORF Transcript_66780/g.132370 Transcript_66780/m.132370 type:complete len:226 (+) Transcript_66780:2124-2801(+)
MLLKGSECCTELRTGHTCATMQLDTARGGGACGIQTGCIWRTAFCVILGRHARLFPAEQPGAGGDEAEQPMAAWVFRCHLSMRACSGGPLHTHKTGMCTYSASPGPTAASCRVALRWTRRGMVHPATEQTVRCPVYLASGPRRGNALSGVQRRVASTSHAAVALHGVCAADVCCRRLALRQRVVDQPRRPPYSPWILVCNFPSCEWRAPVSVVWLYCMSIVALKQ